MTLIAEREPIVAAAVRQLLNICIVCGESRAGTGGLAAYNRLLTRHLTQAGHRVTSVSRFDRQLGGTLDYFSSQPGAAAMVDGLPTTLVRPAAGTGLLLRRLHHFTGRRRLRQLAVKGFCFAYAKSLAAAVPADVDVIHYIGTGWELLGFAALREARRRGAGFTVWPAVHAGTWGDSLLDIDLYNQADAVFCQSDHELEHLAKLGVDRRRLTRAWLAPATDPTGNGDRFRQKHGLGDRPLVLFIARKVRSKGFHTLCEAMPLVLEKVPGACLVAIGPEGEPPYPPVPSAAYLDLGVASDDEKADALAACDVFCMPSAAESFGIVYVEAWSYGKPVIGGPAEAVRELLNGGGGVRIIEQSSPEVVRALIELLSDDALRTQIGRAGYAQHRMKYNWRTVQEVHEGVFSSAVSGSGGGAGRRRLR